MYTVHVQYMRTTVLVYCTININSLSISPRSSFFRMCPWSCASFHTHARRALLPIDPFPNEAVARPPCAARERGERVKDGCYMMYTFSGCYQGVDKQTDMDYKRYHARAEHAPSGPRIVTLSASRTQSSVASFQTRTVGRWTPPVAHQQQQ